MHNYNILCIIKVLLWILVSKRLEYLTHTNTINVWDSERTLRVGITSNYAFSLNRESCAKDRTSERPPLLSPFALFASSVFPVIRTCTSMHVFVRYECVAPRVEWGIPFLLVRVHEELARAQHYPNNRENICRKSRKSVTHMVCVVGYRRE